MLPPPAPSLPAYCEPTSPLLHGLSLYFHTCLPTPLAATSTLLGSLSILSWLFAQLPQIYKNYQLQSTAGLSIFFLIEWCLGDTTNLLGALFTRQAGWQVVVASYYVFVDVCLVCQFFWYTYLKPQYVTGTSLHSSASSDRGDADSIEGLSPIDSNFVDDRAYFPDDSSDNSKSGSPTNPIGKPQFTQVNYNLPSSPSISLKTQAAPSSAPKPWQWPSTPSPRTIIQVATIASLASPTVAAPLPFLPRHLPRAITLMRISTPLEICGTILAWSSTLLYLGSRLPQLYKNWTLRSTAGLSPLLFLAAFCGNLFYSASLLTNPNAWSDFKPHGGQGWADEDGNKRLEWIARAAPFFLGAAGVLVLDACMGAQFMMYGEWKVEEKLVKVRTRHGHSRWRRVEGWMRGWIPEVKGKERVVDLEESQRLISVSREMERRESAGGTGEYGTF